MTKTKKTTKKRKEKIEYKPGTSVAAYVKHLLSKAGLSHDRKKWLRTFDNCVLPKSVRCAVDEAISSVLRVDLLEKWGLNEHFEKGLTNSILIYGPPGTGKTMVSESIAGVLNQNLMRISSGTIQSNIPGQTERNITESFQKALQNKAVILFDECDSLLSNRNNVGTILAAEINTLLTEIERFEGVVILTTNRLHQLDPALQRRIVARVKLDTPNFSARKMIWQKLMPKKMPTGNLDYDKLAVHEVTGGQIKNAIVGAARKAIATGKNKVLHKYFDDAVLREVTAQEEFEDCQPKYVDNSTIDRLRTLTEKFKPRE